MTTSQSIIQSGVWETPYIWKESKTNDAKYNPIYSELFEASIFHNISVDGGFWMVLDGFGLSVCVISVRVIWSSVCCFSPCLTEGCRHGPARQPQCLGWSLPVILTDRLKLSYYNSINIICIHIIIIYIYIIIIYKYYIQWYIYIHSI